MRTKNKLGEHISERVATKFRKAHPLPADLQKVAEEIMGGVDPKNLPIKEVEERLHKFFNITADQILKP